jgi:major capsid protein gp7
MATIGTLKNLIDRFKTIDPDGSEAVIAELLAQENMLLDQMLFKEGNLPTGDRVTIRTGLPTVYWRMMNAGVPSSKSTSAQIDEQCAQVTARSQVDVSIAKLNGNTNEFRLGESKAFIQAMGQEVADTIFYGSASNPEEFVGLANRYNSTTAGNGENILLAGGAGSDNTSVWLLGLGEQTIHGVFPKGSQAGLVHENLGVGDAFDSTTSTANRFRAYMDYYEWNVGLVVKDWRYGVRIANIDISDLAGLSGAQELTDSTFLPKLLSRAYDRLPSMAGIKPVYCMNRTTASLLKVAAMEKSSSAVTIEEGLTQFGQKIMQMKFLGVPVLINDAITNAETLIS